MTTTADSRRVLREQWRRHRVTLGLLETTPHDEFALGGLAALANPLDVRIVVLPADPDAAGVVPLDTDTDTWLSDERPSPYGGQRTEWGHTDCATSHALARASWYRDDMLWERYVAIHRHGGIEAGDSGLTWEARGQRAFALRRTVATIWAALSLQAEAAQRWQVGGPWEINVALRGTKGAMLGDFAEGWAQFGDFNHPGNTCGEPSVFHRWETDALDPEALALDAGARLENSFGTTHRRHIARTGELQGRFDFRFGW